jgi:hypothetical protein
VSEAERRARHELADVVSILTVEGPVLAGQEMGRPHEPAVEERVPHGRRVDGRQHQLAKYLGRPAHRHHLELRGGGVIGRELVGVHEVRGLIGLGPAAVLKCPVYLLFVIDPSRHARDRVVRVAIDRQKLKPPGVLIPVRHIERSLTNQSLNAPAEYVARPSANDQGFSKLDFPSEK